MTYLSDLTHSLAGRLGPSLTFYGHDRTELGAPVVARWLSKTANALGEDFSPALYGDDPAGHVLIDLGCTWQNIMWSASATLYGWSVYYPATVFRPENTLRTDKEAVGNVMSHIPFFASEHVQQGPQQPEHMYVPEDTFLNIRVHSDEESALSYPFSGEWVLLQCIDPLTYMWPGPLPENCSDALSELMSHADSVVVPLLDTAPHIEDVLNGTMSHIPSDISRVLLLSEDPYNDMARIVNCWARGMSVVFVDRFEYTCEDVQRIAEFESATLLL
ncbi:hypothetical protein [Schaalia sp. lx-100]|uniref:hypothetical protein n=1 Tax=Schaalia sp. lx-100 TaxID=2899081 RepID=UPI001E4E6F94|nr:hypothetical protein [Schaalia sp. lx-100]MCD4556753.1 hypothetical protein [Schaalia sp. lx-100]